ncbi:MAG: S8 family serine peptidase, partial [Candidatus Sericytochromatia bacterium]
MPDTNQRYTLHVQQVGKNNSGHQITVNINGTNYFKQESVKGKEAEINTLLLNANNSLRVRLQGKEGSSFIVSIVQGGEAGTLLRRQGRLGQPGENQATRVRRNDTNIFDPSDPDSLGGLMPYEGQLDEEGVPPGVTGVAVDGTSPLQFEAGTLILRLRNPEIILPILQTKYGATVINRVEIPGYPDFVYYYLQFDLSKSPIDQAASLIQAYRQKIPADFKDFVFASPSGFQTFVLLMDLLVNYEEYIATWELNGFSKAPLEPLEPVKVNDWETQDKDPAQVNNRGWWLRDTFVREAWNLSLGTGVNVAYIDRGFKGIFTGNTPNPEFGERLKLNLATYGLQNILTARYSSILNLDPQNPLECVERIPGDQSSFRRYCDYNHGINTAMAGFAQRDNNTNPPNPLYKSNAGVAPNVNLIPYNTDQLTFTYALSLLNIAITSQSNSIDVIGYNMQNEAPIGWTPVDIDITPTNPDGNEFSFTFLRTAFAVITGEKKIPVIVAAGNEGSRCPSKSYNPISKKCEKEFIPASYQDYPSPLNPGDPSKKINLIMVGGAQRDHSKPVPVHPTGDHKPNSTGAIVSWGVPGSFTDKGSNIGPGYIWAPGADIETLHSAGVGKKEPPQIVNENGTSYSCPILTGVVALMKSRNPNLTIQEIKDILASSPTKIDIVHEAPVISKQPFVDAQDAVEQAIAKRPAGSNNPADYKAKDFFAFVQADPTAPNGKVLRFNKYVQPNTGIKDKERRALRSVADNTWNGPLAPGKLTHIKGWADITAGEDILSDNLEILEAQEICAVPASGSCSSSLATFDPILTSGQVTEDSASASYHITLKGENLIADLRNGVAKPLTLAFSGTSTSGTPVNKDMAFASADILSINNDGREVKVRLLKNRLSDSIEAPPSEKLPKGNYKIAFKNTITNKTSNLVGNGSSDFGIKSESSGFTFDNISTTPPPSPPPAVGVWITRDGQRKAVNPSQLLGIGITGLDLSGIEIVVDGQVMPIQQVASNYVSFGLTPNLAPGVKDMLLKLAGNTVTLPEAIEVLAMPPLQETQTLPTVGALQPAPFQINGENFLAIPNYFNGQSYHLNSHIYKWNGTQFSLVQTIPTFGAYDLHPFSVGDQHFLAIANFDQNVYAANSEIYKWN